MAQSKSIWNYSEHVPAQNASKIFDLDQTAQNLSENSHTKFW